MSMKCAKMKNSLKYHVKSPSLKHDHKPILSHFPCESVKYTLWLDSLGLLMIFSDVIYVFMV